MLRISLDLIDSPVLLIPRATGVIYEGQTGGEATLRQAAQGALVPLSREPVDHMPRLREIFEDAPWFGACHAGIDEATAAALDVIFRALPGHSGISVDRARLSESHESWVYVRLGEPTVSLYFGGEAPGEAILYW